MEGKKISELQRREKRIFVRWEMGKISVAWLRSAVESLWKRTSNMGLIQASLNTLHMLGVHLMPCLPSLSIARHVVVEGVCWHSDKLSCRGLLESKCSDWVYWGRRRNTCLENSEAQKASHHNSGLLGWCFLKEEGVVREGNIESSQKLNKLLSCMS